MSAADESPTLGPILGVEGNEPAPTIVQEAVEAFLSVTSGVGSPGLAQVITDDPLDVIQSIIREDTGRNVGHFPMWVRFWREDLRRGALVVLHSPNPYTEVDLLVVAHPGVLNRTVLRALFRWAFYAGGWSRVVARVPPERTDLADLLRRCRFKFEGTARGAVPGAGDLQMWALTAHDALWLVPRSQQPIGLPPTRDPSPPASLKVH